LGEAALFSWDDLVRRAKEMAQQPFVARPPVAPRTVAEIEYKLHQQISQPVGQGLYALGPGECPVTFFHLGRLFPKPVRIHALVDGVAREVLYSKDVFHYPSGHPAEQMPEGAGFAGFRIHDPWDPAHQREPGDWLAFLGASYFRTRGDLHQYGISARGIAINTANPEPPFTEEFPSFRAFWIEPVRAGRGQIYAFLDGPSITGAYRFEITREPTITMDVTCALNLRRDVVRFGIAPLTSMFFYGKINRFIGGDWRPAVHDSEGLAIWNGRGEQIWRPLNNPPRVIVSPPLRTRTQRALAFSSGNGPSMRSRMAARVSSDARTYGCNPSTRGAVVPCSFLKCRHAPSLRTISVRSGCLTNRPGAE